MHWRGRYALPVGTLYALVLGRNGFLFRDVRLSDYAKSDLKLRQGTRDVFVPSIPGASSAARLSKRNADLCGVGDRAERDVAI